jgi:hypothetical protein
MYHSLAAFGHDRESTGMMWPGKPASEAEGNWVRGDKTPLNYTEGTWPHEAVPTTDAPVAVHFSLALARNLDSACVHRGQSHRGLSLAAGLAPNTVGRIVRGEVYPDLATLARLEVASQQPLYPTVLYKAMHPDAR